MVMYILYTSQQQNTLDGDVYIIPQQNTLVMYILYTSQQQNTLDGDVYIIHITTTEHVCNAFFDKFSVLSI